MSVDKHIQKKGQKKEQILQAAADLFLEKDYYQVTVMEIARRAGIGKGTVYEYFSSKEDLFKACFSACADHYIRMFRQHLINETTIKNTLKDIIDGHLDLLKDNHQRLHLLFNERPLSFQELQNWVLERREDLLKGIIELLNEGVAIEQLRGDLDIEMAGRLFLALNYVVIGGMVIIDNRVVNEKQVNALLDIFWNGIGAN